MAVVTTSKYYHTTYEYWKHNFRSSETLNHTRYYCNDMMSEKETQVRIRDAGILSSRTHYEYSRRVR